jgi:uncharacterized membrane protein YfcA
MIDIMSFVVVGFFVSILAYLLGLGGGVLIVPVLTLLFGYPIHVAVATSLISIIAGSVLLASVNLKKDMVNVPLAIVMETVTIAGAVAGSWLSVSVTERPLYAFFSFITLFTAYLMWKKSVEAEDHEVKEEEADGFYDSSYTDLVRGRRIFYKVRNLRYAMGASSFAGFISGMLGVGGGFLKVPAMNILSGVPLKVATATSSFMVGFTAAAGSVIYISKGYVDPVVASAIIIGVLGGTKFATTKLSKLTDRRIKNIFVVFLLIIALQMFIKAVS